MDSPANAPASAREAFAAWRQRTAGNWYSEDAHTQSLLARFGLDKDDPELIAFGRACANEIDTLVRENNRDENLPRLRRYDSDGNRIEAIEHHPTYREIGRLAYRSRVLSLFGEPGRQLQALVRGYLFAQNGEAGHACPMACTAGLVKVLRAAGDPRPDWMQGLLDPDYDHHLRGAQFLTEIQGGSDVGANAVVARPAEGGWVSLTGEKWFCSVIDADLFLVTARGTDREGTAGLQGYVVPRRLDGGRLNHFRIRRLKYKLGTRSMASSEVDFEGALALPVADFRTVMEEVISTSRLFNAVCCSAFLTRAAREAAAYASVRTAFGKPISQFPSVARRVADLTCEAYAARGLSLSLAALDDRLALSMGDEQQRGALRMLTNLNKLWTAERCTLGVRGAIEVLGGNGAIEEFSVLPRLLRDSIVLEAWEGGHNVLCSQILRDCQRLGLHEPMFQWLDARVKEPHLRARLSEVRGRFVAMIARPDAAWIIRDLCEELRPVAQTIVLAEDLDRDSRIDPKLPVIVEHLRISSARDYDPSEDRGLAARVAQIIG